MRTSLRTHSNISHCMCPFTRMLVCTLCTVACYRNTNIGKHLREQECKCDRERASEKKERVKEG